MSVLIDSTAWSLALRRSRAALSAAQKRLVFTIQDLIVSGRACLNGMIAQEVLSGIRSPEEFEQLRGYLCMMQLLPTHHEDHEEAARCFNKLRSHGITASHADSLICAAALRHGMEILTTDADFESYRRVLAVQLHEHCVF
jgi:predicted nucleic acid-binding protein